jgi:hypothetical protein
MIKFFLKLVLSLSPFGLFIGFISSKLYIPNFDFYSWNFMYYWIIYTIPILYYLYFIYSHYKEIFVSFKDMFNKRRERYGKFFFVILTLQSLFVIPWLLILVPFFLPLYIDTSFEDKNDKLFLSYLNKISCTTLFISIYLFYNRFTGSSLFQIELLSGDLLFLIIPFILSSIVVYNSSSQK